MFKMLFLSQHRCKIEFTWLQDKVNAAGKTATSTEEFTVITNIAILFGELFNNMKVGFFSSILTSLVNVYLFVLCKSFLDRQKAFREEGVFLQSGL